MPEAKPQYASDYTPEQLAHSRQTLLHVAAVLGDFSADVVLVGGLVPVLLVDQAAAAARGDAHVGSADVDLVLSFAVVDEERYDTLAARLSQRGFRPATSREGNPRKQTWVYRDDERAVAVDFLIDEEQTTEGDWGRMMHLTHDLGAIRALGARLAFDDAEWREVQGETFDGDHAVRAIQVCGPAAFIVLKAIAFRNRNAPKDAYDLGYVLRHYGESVEALATRFLPLRTHPAARRALDILRDDFADERALGPRSASRFLYSRIDDVYVADFAGDVHLFLRRIAEED